MLVPNHNNKMKWFILLDYGHVDHSRTDEFSYELHDVVEDSQFPIMGGGGGGAR